MDGIMNGQGVLVDPTAKAFVARHVSAPLLRFPCVVALVDGTLNKKSAWGKGMLDAVQQSIAAAGWPATFARIDLNPLDNPQPDLWVASVLREIDAMVVVGGDCVTCTTRGVRDAVWANAAGIRSVSVVTSAVADVAAAVCASYGMPDLPILAVRQSLYGKSRDEIAIAVQPDVQRIGDVLFGAKGTHGE
jgi:hypothetical protein